jgi:hypothetical protein
VWTCQKKKKKKKKKNWNVFEWVYLATQTLARQLGEVYKFQLEIVFMLPKVLQGGATPKVLKGSAIHLDVADHL